MSIDIQSVRYGNPASDAVLESTPHQAKAKPADEKASYAITTNELPQNIEATLHQLESVFLAFNHRLSFSINEKLNEVVVKVIDNDTDKVIKEIPPKELQDLHLRIRESIGLLFDKKI